MPDCEGKPGQGGQDEMPDFAFVYVIVMKGSWSKGQEEQTEQKNRGYAKLSMLQISTEKGRGSNEQGHGQNDGLGRLTSKKGTGKQGKQGDQHGHRQTMDGASHRQGHAHAVKCSPSNRFHQSWNDGKRNPFCN